MPLVAVCLNAGVIAVVTVSVAFVPASTSLENWALNKFNKRRAFHLALHDNTD